MMTMERKLFGEGTMMEEARYLARALAWPHKLRGGTPH